MINFMIMKMINDHIYAVATLWNTMIVQLIVEKNDVNQNLIFDDANFL